MTEEDRADGIPRKDEESGAHGRGWRPPAQLDPDASTAARFGAELRALRGARGLTQEALARLVGFSAQHVGAVERAATSVSEQFVTACDAALRANGNLLELLPLVVWERASDRHRRQASRRASGPKEPIKAIATIVGASPSMLEAVERVMATSGQGRVDRAVISSHVAIGEAMAGLYRSADPTVVLPMAIVYAEGLRDLLDKPMSERGRVEVAPVVVGIHAQIGLWACHAHLLPLANRYLSGACEIAQAIGDRPLRARALGAHSYLFSSAPRGGRGGDPRRALALLDEAMGLATGADGFTRARLAVWRADQYAIAEM